MESLYKSGFWLQQADRHLMVSAGMHFLRASARMAVICYELGEDRYPITPKLHSLYHIVKLVQWQGDISGLALNPVLENCAMDEDFIGRLARVCRAVSPRCTALRTIQRYLLQCHEAFFQQS